MRMDFFNMFVYADREVQNTYPGHSLVWYAFSRLFTVQLLYLRQRNYCVEIVTFSGDMIKNIQ